MSGSRKLRVQVQCLICGIGAFSYERGLGRHLENHHRDVLLGDRVPSIIRELARYGIPPARLTDSPPESLRPTK